MVVKVVVLVDNEPSVGLRNDWGWSAYIEYRGKKILFDADTNPEVVEYNSGKLGVDLSGLDLIVLSHHHYDHYGGLSYVARLNKGARIYVPPGDTSYLEDWGFEPIIARKGYTPMNGVYITRPLFSPGMSLYEIALAISVEDSEPLVLVGCSHPGVDNLLMEALKGIGASRAYLVIGGYHLPSQDQIDRVAKYSRYFYPAHCSGDRAKEYARKTYRDKLVEIRTGTILELPFKGNPVDLRRKKCS